MESIEDRVFLKFKKAGRGSLFFTEDFLSYGSAKAVSKVLERLVKNDKLTRVTRGIYTRLEIDPIL